MANKKEISVQINIGANLEDVQKRLTGLQNKLDKLSLPASVRNEFLGLFSAMDRELEKISQKTAGGKLKLVDSASVGKSIEKIDSLYSALIQKFESRGIATAALRQDQNAISAITSALKVYADSTRSILSEEKKLTAEVQKQERAKEALLEKHKEQKVVSDAELAAQKERVSAATKEANAKAKAVTVARQALEEKIASSGGTYKLSDIDEKGSPLRKTKAYKEYKAAIEASGAANKIKRSEADKFASMTTLEQQKKDIQEVELRITKAKEKLQEFNDTQKATKEIEAFEEIKRQLAELENIDLSKYGIDLAEIKNVEQLEKALEKVKVATQNSAEAFGKEYAQEMKDAGASTNRLEKDVKDATEAVEDLDERTNQINTMQERIKSFLGVSGAAQVMRSALRDAMQTITELDATMTEMAVVTDLSVGDYWNQLPQYSKQASDLGVSINSAYKAATLYYQQGLKSNEVTKISAETLKMARIAGLSAEDATNKMTAALRGFNMELNETSAQRVSDVYSELAAITASDVDEISSAMTKTASIASSAGMEFETTAAFLSQIIETTRESAETAGTALKTVIARFQELKKDPAEIGEVDGEIVDANKIETALRSVGVALRDSSGQFRDLDDVFLELSRKWNTLDTNTQRYIATIAAGSRQQSRFIAMMSDYGRTQQLVTAANNSAGASNKQFEKTLDSLQSKLAKLENAWHEFTMGILESDLVKTGVDMLTTFLEIINKATSALNSGNKAIDGLGNSLSKIIGILAIFKLGQKIFNKFKQPIFNLFTGIATEAGSKGYLAGKNFATEAERGARDAMNQTSGVAIDSDNEESKKQKQSGPGIGGWRAFKGAYEANEDAKAAKSILNNSDYKNAAVEAKAIEEKYTFGQNGQVYKKGVKPGSGQSSVLSKQEADAVKARYSDLNKKAETYAKAEGVLANSSAKKWDCISQGIGAAGDAITTVGIGISLVGGALQSAGFEEAGKAWSEFGQVVTLAGSAISALVPILQLVQMVATAAGISMAAAFGWVTLIVAAVVALGVTIYTTIDQIQKSSPEGKLKAAREEAEAAADAADRATESYNNLSDSLDDLKDKYADLDRLTRGTKEWNEAVQDINGTVMDLIQKYPQLADFLKTEGGVLTLDVENAGVQKVLIDARTVAVAAQNNALAAEQNVMRAEKVNEIGNSAGVEALAKRTKDSIVTNSVVNGASYGFTGGAAGGLVGSGNPLIALLTGAVGGLIGGLVGWGVGEAEGEQAANNIRTDKNIQEKIARAAQITESSGKNIDEQYLVELFSSEEIGFSAEDAAVLAKEYIKDGAETFLQLGRDLNTYDDAIASFSKAMAANARTLIQLPEELADNTEGQEQFWKVANAVLDEADYQRYYEEEYEKIQKGEVKVTEDDKKRFVDQIGGKGAKLENGKIIASDGTIIEENADDRYFKSLLAREKATSRFATAGATAYSFLEKAKDHIPDGVASDNLVERLFSDKEGGELYRGEAEIIRSINAEELFNSLRPEEKELFGSAKKLEEYIGNAASKAEEVFGNSYGFEGVTARAATNLTNITKNTEMTPQEVSNFVEAFNTARASGSAEDAVIFSQLVSGIDADRADQRELWDDILESLETQGITITTQMETFIKNAKEQTDSRYTDTYLKGMGVSEELISHYQNAEGEELARFHKTFSKWKDAYETVNDKGEKTRSELIRKAVDAIIENYEKQIDAQEELYDTINEANDKMLSLLSAKIEEDRQSRKKDEDEQDLRDKRNKLAYLAQDTSGANALEILNLQKDIDETEQAYQDSLIDQSLQKLEDANAKAAEQRERQIELARAQLEAYANSQGLLEKAEGIVDEAIEAITNGDDIQNTTLGKLLAPKGPLTEYEAREFWTELSTQISNAVEEAIRNSKTDEKTPNKGGTPLELKVAGSGGLGPSAVLQVIKEEDGAYVRNMAGGLRGFATGGLADFTGPAWLDGTKSHPEYVLNAAQTERFFSLVDVLDSLDTSKVATDKQSGGDNHFDIEINVEKLENDYDVEQLVDKIRRMIYEDASYRNVNTVSLR